MLSKASMGSRRNGHAQTTHLARGNKLSNMLYEDKGQWALALGEASDSKGAGCDCLQSKHLPYLQVQSIVNKSQLV